MLRLTLALAVLAAALAAAGCGGGSRRVPPERLTSRQLCDLLDLGRLEDLTRDPWKRALPKKGYVGCEVQVTEDAPARLYVSIEGEAATPKPDRKLAREFFDEDTHFEGFAPVKGVGDLARFRAEHEDLFVLDGAVIYSVQVLSDHVDGRRALEPALAIYRIVAGKDED